MANKRNLSKKSLQLEYDWSSRKYRTAWYLTVLFSGLLVVPGLASLFITLFVEQMEFTLLPVGYYVTLVAGIWGIYFGANLTEKLSAFQPKEAPPADFLNNIIETVDNDRGGQPTDSDNP